MSKSVLDKVEHLILLIAEFSARYKVTKAQAYRYLNQYGALALCDKHYNIMHTLSVEENIQTLQAYCHPKTGLYFQSSGYAYDFLLDELGRKN